MQLFTTSLAKLRLPEVRDFARMRDHAQLNEDSVVAALEGNWFRRFPESAATASERVHTRIQVARVMESEFVNSCPSLFG